MKKEAFKNPFEIAQQRRREKEKELLDKEQVRMRTGDIEDVLASTQDAGGEDDEEEEESPSKPKEKEKSKKLAKSNKKSKGQSL